jgi:hypothetical protein
MTIADYDRAAAELRALRWEIRLPRLVRPLRLDLLTVPHKIKIEAYVMVTVWLDLLEKPQANDPTT